MAWSSENEACSSILDSACCHDQLLTPCLFMEALRPLTLHYDQLLTPCLFQEALRPLTLHYDQLFAPCLFQEALRPLTQYNFTVSM